MRWHHRGSPLLPVISGSVVRSNCCVLMMEFIATNKIALEQATQGGGGFLLFVVDIQTYGRQELTRCWNGAVQRRETSREAIGRSLAK